MQKRILVIEDDIDIRNGLQELLEDEGYKVDIAQNGEIALEKLRNDSQFNVLLLDLMMPVMDGYGFLNAYQKLILEGFKEIPVFLLTAAGDRAKNVQGVKAMIRKPVDIDFLLSQLKVI